MDKGWVAKGRPANDNEYFEALTLNIFRAGLDWRMVERKWPAIKRAFDEFDIAKVADYTPLDVEQLMGDAGIIRNRRKIEAAIENANTALALIEEYGSFANYIRTIDEIGWQPLVKDLVKRFKHLGQNSALHFLHSVGEDVPRPPERRRR
jgi:DNA-3-methyladenine glycosylase I